MKKILFLIFLGQLSNGVVAQTLHLIGDSTMAIKTAEKYPETGWGQVLGVLSGGALNVRNYAKNGRSSKSFIDEGRWDKVKAQFSKGDYLLVQFGHNDQKHRDPSRYTKPLGSYSKNLTMFINQARDAGVEPILATSIVRRKFSPDGSLKDTHKEYLVAVRQVAKSLNVPIVDMEKQSRALVLELGQLESTKLFLHGEKGEHRNYPNGIEDNTHLRESGALKMASLFVRALANTSSSLSEFFK